jgi:hypothetical protein
MQVKGNPVTVKTTMVSTSVLGKTNVDDGALTGGDVNEQRTMKSEDQTKQAAANPVHASRYEHAFRVAGAFIPQITTSVFSNEKEKTQSVSLELPNLQQMLDDLSARGANFIASNELANDRSSVADDGASVNTRNEYWSVSSFHSKTHIFEDGNEISEDAVPPPLPELYQDFELPIESLLKPMKKSTYNPIFQEDVQKFLAAGAWGPRPSTEQPKEGLWTAKKVPLQPVKVSVGSVSVDTPKPQKDGFLESFDTFGADIEVRQTEFFTKYMDSYTYTLSENVVATMDQVRKINTQNTNPPDWYLRRLEQQRAIGTKSAVTPKQQNLAVPLVVTTSPPPIPLKVHP